MVLGSRLRRIGVPLALTAAATAVCYPMRTVGVLKVAWAHCQMLSYLETGPVFSLTASGSLKVTGEKVYAGSSLVASALKSQPREEFIVPGASVEVSDMYIRIDTCMGHKQGS